MENLGLLLPLCQKLFLPLPLPSVASSAKETHCLKENLDQNMKQERLINHQLTLSKDKFKILALII
jgi:hypothetical protein